MSAATITGQIVFYYPHTSLFEDVQEQSAYMCKNIVSKDGDELVERFIITPDEEHMFKLCLREALPSVYTTIRVLTHGIENAIVDSMSNTDLNAIISGTLPAGNYVVIRVMDNGAYNPNEVKIADSALQTAIELGTLSEFYTRVVEQDLTKLSAAKFAAQIKVLAKSIIGLRKKSVL